MHADALASVPRALTALVYTRRSLPTARKFAHAFFLSRAVDLRPMLKFTDPKKALKDTLLKLGRERPASRSVRPSWKILKGPNKGTEC
jgi:large subunit ribosomal protein L44